MVKGKIQVSAAKTDFHHLFSLVPQEEELNNHIGSLQGGFSLTGHLKISFSGSKLSESEKIFFTKRESEDLWTDTN